MISFFVTYLHWKPAPLKVESFWVWVLVPLVQFEPLLGTHSGHGVTDQSWLESEEEAICKGRLKCTEFSLSQKWYLWQHHCVRILIPCFLLGTIQNIQLIIVVVRYPQDQPWQYPEECDDLIQRWSHESLAGHIHLISALICEHPKFKVIQFVCLFYWCNRTLRKQKILHSWHSMSPGGSSGYVELHLGTWPSIYAFQSTWIFWQSLMLIHWAAFQMSHSFWCLVCFF